MAAEEQIESEFHYDHILESIAPLFESITEGPYTCIFLFLKIVSCNYIRFCIIAGAKHLSEKLHEDENPEMSELLTRGFE